MQGCYTGFHHQRGICQRKRDSLVMDGEGAQWHWVGRTEECVCASAGTLFPVCSYVRRSVPKRMFELFSSCKQARTGLAWAGWMFSGPHLSHRNLCWSQLWQGPIKPAISGSFHTECVQADFPFKSYRMGLTCVSKSSFYRTVWSTGLSTLAVDAMWGSPAQREAPWWTWYSPRDQGGELINISPPKSSIWEQWKGGCTPCVLCIHLFFLLKPVSGSSPWYHLGALDWKWLLQNTTVPLFTL